MILNISFKQLNNEYSESLAKELEFDKESISNPKYLLENSIELTDEIDEILIEENIIIPIEMESPTGEIVKFIIKNMFQIQCLKNSEVVAKYSVSNNLLHNTHKIKKENSKKTYYYFYLKDREDYTIIDKSIYVLKNELSIVEKLINGNKK